MSWESLNFRILCTCLPAARVAQLFWGQYNSHAWWSRIRLRRYTLFPEIFDAFLFMNYMFLSHTTGPYLLVFCIGHKWMAGTSWWCTLLNPGRSRWYLYFCRTTSLRCFRLQGRFLPIISRKSCKSRVHRPARDCFFCKVGKVSYNISRVWRQRCFTGERFQQTEILIGETITIQKYNRKSIANLKAITIAM